MSKELDYIEDALNVAAKAGGAFTLKESAQIQHCVDVTRSKLNELQKMQEELSKKAPDQKPGPSLTKDDPIKPANHK